MEVLRGPMEVAEDSVGRDHVLQNNNKYTFDFYHSQFGSCRDIFLFHEVGFVVKKP